MNEFRVRLVKMDNNKEALLKETIYPSRAKAALSLRDLGHRHTVRDDLNRLYKVVIQG